MPRETIFIETTARAQAIEITDQARRIVAQSGVKDGWCTIFVPHTTAAVTINEAADPAVMADVLRALEGLVPWSASYAHQEGNSAAHIKAILTGSSARAPVSGGRLGLGQWQGLFFMEFDGPRRRRALVDVSAG
ncbi:protein of unknown function UPF0047 [Desulfarculus baarsii DSM 2075]|uniref:Secondary thiamine-phosphate synthase enzyme n=1 Tax=Desulfarculus baarsii (strain ATCC 33931 / DSM 2075 / LMG 7858 / VKM B-1802 / 2st14) TaxID=644282 RepID=E1QFJ8_DESB2|nr:secondary thiamine-phosphate synthase enzyme YjbQ [Desulfarculus baarsii]ADK84334.1 protein of unknown function UPF0047 [Desulfarculus baarsii DSM 2075]